MAQYRTVTEFLQKAKETYQAARKEYETTANAIIEHEKRHREEIARGWRNAAERADFLTKSEKRNNDLKKELRSIIDNAQKSFDEIAAECDSVFERHFRPTPEKVDANAVELLRSDILTTAELMALAKDYENNIAMKRIIGEHIKAKGEKENNAQLKAYGNTLSEKPADYKQTYMQPLNSVILFSMKALREDVMLSNSIAEIWDQQFEKSAAEAEKISVCVAE